MRALSRLRAESQETKATVKKPRMVGIAVVHVRNPTNHIYVGNHYTTYTGSHENWPKDGG